METIQDDWADKIHKKWFSWVDDMFDYWKRHDPHPPPNVGGIRGGTPSPQEVMGWHRVYEQGPGWGETIRKVPSSNFGPGGYSGVPNEIGLWSILQRQWGVNPARRNDWIKVQFADGTIMWRRLLETSAAPGGMGIEFWVPKGGAGKYERHGKARILEVRHGAPDVATIDLHRRGGQVERVEQVEQHRRI